MTVGIYYIRNTAAGKIYIGQPKAIEKRFNQHRSDLNNGIHRNPRLQKDWVQFGSAAFDFGIIRETSLDDLIALELAAIMVHSADNPEFGYNIKHSHPIVAGKYTEFSQALAQTPVAGIELSDDTRSRYMRGVVPNQFDWLVRHPVLIRALLRVAEAYQSQTADQIAA